MLYVTGNVRAWRSLVALLALSSALLMSLARAQAPAPVGAQGTNDTLKADHPAQAIVALTTSKVLAVMRAERASGENRELRFQAVSELVLPNFDFERMSAYVLARHWRRASDAERDAFVTQFRRLLVRTYYSALEQYADRRVRYEPTRVRSANSRVVVRSLIDGPSGASIPVNYSMYPAGEGADYWKVYDVQIDGISLVINYRASFDTEVKQRGLAKLVDTLREKNDAAMTETGLTDGSTKVSG